jgi:8-oxo-dGTP pyrophosphatase MutT (NUDIX family)
VIPATVTIPNASVPIGRTSVKKVPTKERELATDVVLKAAGIMIVTPDSCVLFLKRATGHDHEGEWCLPGGAIESGETAELAAIRECREETGHVPEGKLKEIYNSISPEGVDFTTFALQVNNPFIAELDDEHVGWAWAPLDDPPEPLHPGVAKTLKAIVDTDEIQDVIGKDEKAANVATPAELRSVIKFPPPKAANATREIDQSFARGGAGKELQQ